MFGDKKLTKSEAEYVCNTIIKSNLESIIKDAETIKERCNVLTNETSKGITEINSRLTILDTQINNIVTTQDSKIRGCWNDITKNELSDIFQRAFEREFISTVKGLLEETKKDINTIQKDRYDKIVTSVANVEKELEGDISKTESTVASLKDQFQSMNTETIPIERINMSGALWLKAIYFVLSLIVAAIVYGSTMIWSLAGTYNQFVAQGSRIDKLEEGFKKFETFVHEYDKKVLAEFVFKTDLEKVNQNIAKNSQSLLLYDQLNIPENIAKISVLRADMKDLERKMNSTDEEIYVKLLENKKIIESKLQDAK